MRLRRRNILLAGFGMLAAPALAEEPRRIEVWRDPTCGCCEGWVAHMRNEGFRVEETVVRSVAPVRRMLGTPADLLSCHAARIEGLVLEGHVPALAVRRLLATRPHGIRGIAVPGMPVGSPGMEVPGQAPDTYDVIAFGVGEHRLFMRFRGGEVA